MHHTGGSKAAFWESEKLAYKAQTINDPLLNLLVLYCGTHYMRGFAFGTGDFVLRLLVSFIVCNYHSEVERLSNFSFNYFCCNLYVVCQSLFVSSSQ